MQYEEVLAKQWDLVIIGAGPGGMGAALYASRADLATLVVEKQYAGGLIMLTHEVENYPCIDKASGMDLGMKLEQQCRKFGTEFLLKEVRRVDRSGAGFAVTLADGKSVSTATVVIASGSAPRRLPCPGEQEFYGKGVSYCATCDGAFFRDKEVVVVGGGESAFQEGLFLTQFASKVTLVHRREGFRATELAIRRARANAKWHEKLNYVVEEIYGDETMQGVKLKHAQTGEIEDFPCDGIFGFIGYDPASASVSHLVETDEEGYVVGDLNMRTSVHGIWVAGDILKGAKKQMVISAGNGATAAMDIREYLAERD
ncbi:thioredoxin-disulfide reductase [bacterium]|nr:thioredoxin-disulfide reductase [bacterium]